jgi:tetrahedral aminopeptidase
VHTEKGTIPAVFGWPAIHVREDKDKAPQLDIEKVVLDCGCSSAEEVAALGIHVGSVVTFDADLLTLNRDFLIGRGIDNRIGGFMIAEVARKLYENKQKLPFGLYIVNAVQEEVGLNGAAMIARRLKPDLAIVTDVTHDTQSPLYNKIKEGDIACNKGPVLSYAPSVQHNVLKMLIEVAENNKIPFQRQASSSYTGTDTDAFAYSSAGVASGLVSLPLRYMHTTVEMVHRKDIEHVIALMYQFLIQLDPQHSFSYFK